MSERRFLRGEHGNTSISRAGSSEQSLSLPSVATYYLAKKK